MCLHIPHWSLQSRKDRPLVVLILLSSLAPKCLSRWLDLDGRSNGEEMLDCRKRYHAESSNACCSAMKISLCQQGRHIRLSRQRRSKVQYRRKSQSLSQHSLYRPTKICRLIQHAPANCGRSAYDFAFERSPANGTIAHSVFSSSIPRNNLAHRDQRVV